MSGLRSTVSSGVASIRSSFNSLGSIASSAYRWGADICSQMAAGVRAAARSVIAAAENVASRVRSLLHFSVPDEGPLSDADTYMPDFMKLLATGIKKNVKSVVKAVKGLAGSMSSNLTTPVDSLGDWMDSVVGGFATTIKRSQRDRQCCKGCRQRYPIPADVWSFRCEDAVPATLDRLAGHHQNCSRQYE